MNSKRRKGALYCVQINAFLYVGEVLNLETSTAAGYLAYCEKNGTCLRRNAKHALKKIDLCFAWRASQEKKITVLLCFIPGLWSLPSVQSFYKVSLPTDLQFLRNIYQSWKRNLGEYSSTWSHSHRRRNHRVVSWRPRMKSIRFYSK